MGKIGKVSHTFGQISAFFDDYLKHCSKLLERCLVVINIHEILFPIV